MGQALYRVYRSKSLEEVVGQDHIITILKQALKTNSLSHAYLFTGPRGVGKTSVARILAYELNKAPYNDPTTSIDIIEIDAASHRRIDEIRELRDRVQVAPTNSKYKVYIIDEVHMLTNESFNALLKTLEEPPQHVIFILATTEAYKLPETIISRTQRFNFKPVDRITTIKHLSKIAKIEKINIDEPALELIADHSRGSLRDALSMLDQVRNMSNPVSSDGVLNLLGLASDEAIDSIVESLENRDMSEVIKTIRSMREQGIEAPTIAKQLGIRLRANLLNNKPTLGYDSTIDLLRRLIEIPASVDPMVALETVLMATIINNGPALETQKPSLPIETASKKIATPEVIEKPPIDIDNKKPDLENGALWEAVINSIKQSHNTLYGIVRMATPAWEGNSLTLKFKFSFHQKKMNEPHNQALISELIESISGKQYTIVCVVDKTAESKPAADNQTSIDNKDVENISNIFGGAELLES
jgi:DNA polymerase-3 subunit gamma/tau